MIRTVTVAVVARLVRFRTVPVSVPAVAPPFSELTVETETPGAANAGPAASPDKASVSSAAPVARTFRPSICNPLLRARRAQTQKRATLQETGWDDDEKRARRREPAVEIGQRAAARRGAASRPRSMAT